MIKDFLSEITVAVVMVILLLVLVNPTEIFMTTSMEMMLVVGLVLLFALFASFVMREKVRDEREAMLRMMADRVGFLAGCAFLMLGVIVESFQHKLSDWLLIALASMIIAKIIGAVYGRIKG